EVDTERLTASGLAVGTPHYLSPEQAAAEKDVGPKADQYALACVLYEMLVGEPPFTGPTASAIAMRHIAEQAVALRIRRRTAPEPVESAVKRAMEKVPADRFDSISTFSNAAHASVREDLNPAVMNSPHAVPRFPRVKYMALGAFVLLIGTGLLAFSHDDRVSVWPGERWRTQAAREKIARGDLTSALSDLRSSAVGVRANAERTLWLAQVLLMTNRDTSAEWRRAARDAAAERASLSGNDTLLASAMGALAMGRFDLACPAFRSLRTGSNDVTDSFDLAECLARDGGVVKDPVDSSKWRFRSNPAEAVALYSDLLRQLPNGHQLRLTILRHLPLLLTTEWGQYRKGFAVEDSTRLFGAFPSVVHGTGGAEVGYDPHPLSDFRSGRPWMNPPTLEQALELERSQLRRVGAALVDEDPTNPESHQVFAHALELEGELSSTDTTVATALREVTAARRSGPSVGRDLDLRMAEVRILVKVGDFRMARAKADSAIARAPSANAHAEGNVENLLALTGQSGPLRALARRMATIYSERMPDGRRFHPNPMLGEAALEFSLEAKLGAPRDTLRRLLALVDKALDSYAAPKARDSVRIALLARSLVSAVPILGPSAVNKLPPVSSIIPAQQAFARGDRRGARTILDSLRQIRANHPAAGARLDQIYQEAWLRAAVADTAGAIAELDLALNGLPALGTLFLATVSESAALTRAMFLRAALAEQTRDAAAGSWRTNAEALVGPVRR
ncbi:MAG: protein kinase, partial [Gemmatimonadetes bacterium]|nr:protein kinase [Gemmatimonadota bacterium]